ncbi:MAG: hypothetical protein CL878_07400 [Dehalococcoidia bacterium]|nr:hypothetical protein [Dehalococcoidia bacterium]
MQLSLLENQPIRGLRSLFVATSIVLFVGLFLGWAHSPSWYVATVAPFMLIFIGAMGLGQGWHYSAYYTLSRLGPDDPAGGALRSVVERWLSWSPRLWLRPRVFLARRAQTSGAASFDDALDRATQVLDSAAHALPATVRRSAVLTALDVIQTEAQGSADVPRLTRRLAQNMLVTGVRSRLQLAPGAPSLWRLLGQHSLGLGLALVAASGVIVVVGSGTSVGPGPAFLSLLLAFLAVAGTALWLVGAIIERR